MTVPGSHGTHVGPSLMITWDPPWVYTLPFKGLKNLLVSIIFHVATPSADLVSPQKVNVNSFILFVGICCVKQYVDKSWMHMLSFWHLITDANVKKTN